MNCINGKRLFSYAFDTMPRIQLKRIGKYEFERTDKRYARFIYIYLGQYDP